MSIGFAHRTRNDYSKAIAYLEQSQVNIDNLLDIARNKFSALFDWHEAKDLVDVYFLCHGFMPFDDIFANTRKKHVGLDEYWMAHALENVSLIEKLPRMLKPLDLPTLSNFFNRLYLK